MIWRLRHPTFETLSRYVDRELERGRHERVAAHLASCARCRATIRFVHELRAVARALPVPDPAEDALERILARRAAGERVILPVSGPVAVEPAPRRRLLPAAVILIPLLVASTLIFGVPRLRADRSRLEFSPAAPTAGQTVRVIYESGAALEGEARLTLRARYRYADGRVVQGTVAELARRGDEFAGVVDLPDSVVYAVFAVEDPEAERVDSNGRRLWELLIHDDRGRPLFEALRERRIDLMGRNWEEAHETAREMVRRYPDRVEGWSTLLGFDLEVAGPTVLDSVIEVHRERFERLASRYEAVAAGPAADPREIAALVMYAELLGDEASADRWRDRLVERFPDHPQAVEARIVEVTRRFRGDPVRRLAEIEAIWREIGQGHPSAVAYGITAAYEAGDAAALGEWIDRYAEYDPSSSWELLLTTARHSMAKTEWAQRLREEIGRLDGPAGEERDLHLTRSDQRGRRERARRQLLVALGATLLELGRTEEALDTLRLAVVHRWEPHLYRTVADLMLARGDTAGAVSELAKAAVDPLTNANAVSHIARRGIALAGGAGWDAALARARAGVREEVLATSVRRKISEDAPLVDLQGNTASLLDLLGARVTVVAFWSPSSGPAIRDLPELQRLAERLEPKGIGVVAITRHEPAGGLKAYMESHAITFPVFIDRRGAAARIFGQWGTPEYYIVDHEGRIRFEHSDLEDILWQASVLNGERAVVASGRDPNESAPRFGGTPSPAVD
jgi:peroxiredoxin